MGVLQCDRNDCEEILCDRYNRDYGYICDGCFEELVDSRRDIQTFMLSSARNERDTKRAYYEAAFPKY